MNLKIYQVCSLLVIMLSIGLCQSMELDQEELEVASESGNKRKRQIALEESEERDAVEKSAVSEELIAFPTELLDLVNKELAQGQKSGKKRKQEDPTLSDLPVELLDYIIRNYLLPSASATAGQVLSALEDVVTFINSSKELAPFIDLPSLYINKNLAKFQAIKNFKGENLLSIAIKEKRWLVAELLINAGFLIRVDLVSSDLLFGWAVSNGHTVLARKMIDIPKQKIFKLKKKFASDLAKAGKLLIDRNISIGLLESQLASNKQLTESLNAAVSFKDVLTVNHMISLQDKKTKESLLHRAIVNGKIGSVQLLLNEGASVNEPNGLGSLPIHIAVRRGSLPLVKLLVQYGANVNSPETDPFKETPLIIAAIQGNPDIVTFLLDNKAQVDAKMSHGITALAAVKLVSNGSSEYNRIIHLLVSAGATQEIKVEKLEWLLAFAYKKRYMHMLAKLLELGTSVNAKFAKGETLLMIAALNRNSKLVDLLLAHKAEVNAQGENGGTALHYAVMSGHIDIARRLIEHEAYVEAPDKVGFTALMIAAQRGRVDCLSLLLAHGAKVHARTEKKSTALCLAVGAGHLETTRLLIEAGAQVNVQDIDGNSPLYWATCRKSLALMEFLVANGATIDQANLIKITPLMRAVLANDTQAVSFLLAKGANVHLVDLANKTALDLAIEKGFKEIIGLLTSANKRGKK